MISLPVCQHERSVKFGKDRHGNQRFLCRDCGKTWTEERPRPLGNMRIPLASAVMVLRQLFEGSSVRVTERLTGVHRNTIFDLLVLVGERCRLYWQERMRGIQVDDVEVDEIWGFVGAKEKTAVRMNKPDTYGDAWTFVGIERTSRLVVSFHVGKRTPEDARWFLDGLRDATEGRFQLSTDGWTPYCTEVVESLACRQVAFAQLIKIYRTVSGAAGRYSPAEITGIRRRNIMGNPDQDRVCTSHAERSNLNIRTFVRRMTRLTNGFSKKWLNHECAMAMYFLHYNFVRKHGTLKTTPAVAAGIAEHPWSVEEMLWELAKCDR